MEVIKYRGFCDDQTGSPMKQGELTYEHGPLMLCSGQLDLSGRDIYEDDIVVCDLFDDSIGVVCYMYGTFVVQWCNGAVTGIKITELNTLPVDVIGNIYEGEIHV
jgi:hypothetical protein